MDNLAMGMSVFGANMQKKNREWWLMAVLAVTYFVGFVVYLALYQPKNTTGKFQIDYATYNDTTSPYVTSVFEDLTSNFQFFAFASTCLWVSAVIYAVGSYIEAQNTVLHNEMKRMIGLHSEVWSHVQNSLAFAFAAVIIRYVLGGKSIFDALSVGVSTFGWFASMCIIDLGDQTKAHHAVREKLYGDNREFIQAQLDAMKDRGFPSGVKGESEEKLMETLRTLDEAVENMDEVHKWHDYIVRTIINFVFPLVYGIFTFANLLAPYAKSVGGMHQDVIVSFWLFMVPLIVSAGTWLMGFFGCGKAVGSAEPRYSCTHVTANMTRLFFNAVFLIGSMFMLARHLKDKTSI